MQTCIVCQAFPKHKGTHYSLRDVRNLGFARRRFGTGRDGEMPLEGAYTAEGESLSVSIRMSNQPSAVHVEGLWLIPYLGALGSAEEQETEPEAGGAMPPELEPAFSMTAEHEGLEAARELRRRRGPVAEHVDPGGGR